MKASVIIAGVVVQFVGLLYSEALQPSGQISLDQLVTGFGAIVGLAGATWKNNGDRTISNQ